MAVVSMRMHRLYKRSLAGQMNLGNYDGLSQLNPTQKTNSYRAGDLYIEVIPLEKETC